MFEPHADAIKEPIESNDDSLTDVLMFIEQISLPRIEPIDEPFDNEQIPAEQEKEFDIR